MNKLEDRIEKLEAIHEIQQLKALGMYYADRQDAAGFAALFADDGVFKGIYQRHCGPDEIQKGLRFFPFAIHYAMNPIITVAGDRAYGRWYTLRPQIDHAGNASWAAGWYDDEYVRIHGKWKFKSVTIAGAFQCQYDAGWSRDSVTAPAEISKTMLETLMEG